MPYKKPTIFISYASDDAAIASVIEKGLEKLHHNLDRGLEIIRDVHSFKTGSTLKDTIIENLEIADFLFIVYTDRLKKSHSYTGFEIGSFRTLIHQDTRAHKKTDRRIVSLYFDELPAPEKDMLGIKLDMRALGPVAATSSANRIDPSDSLSKFFDEIVELYVRRSFDPSLSAPGADLTKHAADIASVREAKQAIVRKDVMPIVEEGLINAFSSLVANSSVEQLLIELRWDSVSGPKKGTQNVLPGSELIASRSDAFRIFGINQSGTNMSWDKFCTGLKAGSSRHSSFILNAIEDAARSALSAGPVDNEQFFVSPDGNMYRIIVTRHYAYYDGSRHMNLYLVPMLSRFSDGLPSIVLALLNVACRYKSKFLEKKSEFSPDNYKLVRYDFPEFRALARRHLRALLLIEDESHVYRLDDPAHYREYYGDQRDPEGVANLFAEWKRQREAFVEAANKIIDAEPNEQDNDKAMDAWIKAIETFNDYAAPLNKGAGAGASERLNKWFVEGNIV